MFQCTGLDCIPYRQKFRQSKSISKQESDNGQKDTTLKIPKKKKKKIINSVELKRKLKK